MSDPAVQSGNRLRRIMQDMRLRTKLFLFVSMAGVIPLVAASFMLDRNMSDLVRDELGRSHLQTVRQYADKTAYKLSLYGTILHSVASNRSVTDLLDSLATEDSTNPYDIALLLTRDVGMLMGTSNLKDVRNVMLYTADGLREVYGPKVSSERLVSGLPWYRAMMASGRTDFYHVQKFQWQRQDSVYYLSFTTPVITSGEFGGQRRGIVKLDVNANLLFEPVLDQEASSGYSIFVTGRNDELIYGDPRKFVFLRETWKDNRTEGSLDGRQTVLVTEAIGQYDWKVHFLFDNGELEKRTGKNRLAIYFLAATALCVIFLLTGLLSGSITGRIQTLVRKMEKVEGGDLEIRNVLAGNDEIGVMDGHFNRMVNRLEESIRVNYVREIESRAAELNALQSQIHPHFLYNTLETISAMAARKGAMEVCDLIHRLGVMFRYSIDMPSKGWVALREELEHVSNYVQIQQARQPGRFELFIDADGSVLRCRVMKFILQPIVENAILHGFRDLEGTHSIEISIRMEGEIMQVAIQDDGRGMPESRVEELNRSLQEEDGDSLLTRKASIGIKNVHMRLKLAYGDGFGLVIRSAEGIGTRVEYTLKTDGVQKYG